jgi:hypothetical protein
MSNKNSKEEWKEEKEYVNNDGRCIFDSGYKFNNVKYNGRK